MLRLAVFIARKDLLLMLRRRETIVWTFIMPIVFFYFIGSITGGFGGSDEARPPRLAVTMEAGAGFLAGEIITRLEEQGFEITTPRPGQTPARSLTLPGRLTERVLSGETVRLEVIDRTDRPLEGMDIQVRAMRAVYTTLADLALAAGGGDGRPTAEDLRQRRQRQRTITLEVTTAGRRREPPSGFAQAVPGTLVMFTLLVTLTSGAVLLVLEREQGLLRRLACAPISRGGVIAGKVGGKWLLALVQVGFALLAGRFLFGYHWGAALPALLAVLVLWSAFCACCGVCLGCVARSRGQAIGLGVLTANLLAAIGGCWWPIEITPAWMQRLSLLLPTGWAMDAFHRLVSFGDPPAAILPHLAALAVATVAVGHLATRLFRYE
ncbi:MAG: ABC transporter permease [Acidobacteriota bacterium]|nr:ABC transporter permease [Acidobacteriota bacterium]